MKSLNCASYQAESMRISLGFEVAALIFIFVHCFIKVADSWESLDGWLDAIRLVYTIYVRGKSDVLAGIITG
jgi:hypothetical protein